MGTAIHLPRLPVRADRQLARRAIAQLVHRGCRLPHRHATSWVFLMLRRQSQQALPKRVLEHARQFSLDSDGLPQRDERLGWTGDLALFAPTAAYIYQSAGILKNWHVDLALCQKKRDGLPPMVCPDPLEGDKHWDLWIPFAIWHDVTVLGPWAVYSATGDVEILRTQYESMQSWIGKIRRYEGGSTPNLWHPEVFQLGVSVLLA